MITLAYLDPGSGSLILQVLVGGVAGAVVFIRLRWRRWTGRTTSSSEAGDPVPEGDER